MVKFIAPFIHIGPVPDLKYLFARGRLSRLLRGSMKKRTCFAIIILLSISLVSAACGGSKDPAADVVLAYQKALIGGDFNQLAPLTCPAWEAQAHTEFDSFAAVKANLKNATCQTEGKEGSTSLVKCTGKIIANYGNESLEIDLSTRTYQVTNQGGEWRMCGYR